MDRHHQCCPCEGFQENLHHSLLPLRVFIWRKKSLHHSLPRKKDQITRKKRIGAGETATCAQQAGGVSLGQASRQASRQAAGGSIGLSGGALSGLASRRAGGRRSRRRRKGRLPQRRGCTQQAAQGAGARRGRVGDHRRRKDSARRQHGTTSGRAESPVARDRRPGCAAAALGGPGGAAARRPRRGGGRAARQCGDHARHLTAKSDVYSYGVVLLELLSGQRALDKSRPPGQHSLVEWARPYITSKRRVVHVLDSRLGAQYSLPAAQKTAALAMQCLSMDARCRPGMDQVVAVLEQLQEAKSATKAGR